jgi:N-acetylglucosaminyl-diphospho-decaprenol L-rhamnosyltransferase
MTVFAIVTVIHNSEAELGGLLGSVARHLDPRPRVVVVDSGSSDRGAALASDWGAEVVDLGANLGFGAANNAGLERVREPVTVLLNPDVELLDDGLVRLADLAASHEALEVPRLLNADGSVQDSAHPLPGTLEAFVPALLPRPMLPGAVRRRYEPWRSETAHPVGWALAACLAARTELLRRLGPFDPDAFLFYEDMELCLRAREQGVPTMLRPEIRVRHLGGTSTGRALGSRALELHARRRREVVGRRGRLALAIDDASEAATFGLRAAARRLARRGGELEQAKLRALREARRSGTGPPQEH